MQTKKNDKHGSFLPIFISFFVYVFQWFKKQGPLKIWEHIGKLGFLTSEEKVEVETELKHAKFSYFVNFGDQDEDTSWNK